MWHASIFQDIWLGLLGAGFHGRLASLDYTFWHWLQGAWNKIQVFMRARKQNRIATECVCVCVRGVPFFFLIVNELKLSPFVWPKSWNPPKTQTRCQPLARRWPFFSGQQLIVVSPIVANFLLCVLNGVIKTASTGNYKCPYNVSTSAD